MSNIPAIKTATKTAIKLAGGLVSLRRATRVAETQISDYSNHERPAVIPVDVAIDLDSAAQEPLILSVMANAEGYMLVRSSFGEHGHVPRDLAKYAKATSEVLQSGFESLEDGQIDVEEARSMLADLQRSRLISGHLEAALNKIIHENKPHIVTENPISGAA